MYLSCVAEGQRNYLMQNSSIEAGTPKPSSMDLTSDGMIVAADKNNHVVKFIAPDRTLVQVLGDGRRGRGDYQLTTPEGVEIHGSTLWIADSGNDRVIKYRFEVK